MTKSENEWVSKEGRPEGRPRQKSLDVVLYLMARTGNMEREAGVPGTERGGKKRYQGPCGRTQKFT